MTDARLGVGGRVLAALGALGALAVLVTAAWLDPSPEGHGTHTQTGMPACGWYVGTGKPCPTCGMTTAFAHSADARFGAAFVTQPLGALLALLTSACCWGGLHVAATGSRIGSVFAGMVRPVTLWIGGGLVVAAWIYKLGVT